MQRERCSAMNRNIERRYVARRLCDLVGEHMALGGGISKDELLDELGVHIVLGRGFANPVDVCCLAELIDRPTCSNVDDSRYFSKFEPWFECSFCHCRTKLGHISMPLRYCPFCGAEVIAND